MNRGMAQRGSLVAASAASCLREGQTKQLHPALGLAVLSCSSLLGPLFGSGMGKVASQPKKLMRQEKLVRGQNG